VLFFIAQCYFIMQSVSILLIVCLQMSAHRLTVEVSDGGRPPLTDSAAVVVVVSDKNDNPPIFAECNLTAVVQEGGQLGRQLLTTAISDADADPNAGPFQLKIEGAGAESFTFEEMTLKSTARLVYANKDIYLLTVLTMIDR
jgi:hypothetical protein